MIKKVLQFTEEKDLQVLIKKCEKVKEVTPEIKQLVTDLFDTCDNSPIWVWLSSNQIWSNDKVFVIANWSFRQEFINWHILEASWMIVDKETCLSFANWKESLTRRASKIKVWFIDINWNKQQKMLKGFNACIFQHELDHMNWVII